jgi:hypothetical protein
MSDMNNGTKIGYQAGTCTLVSTPGDGSDRVSSAARRFFYVSINLVQQSRLLAASLWNHIYQTGTNTVTTSPSAQHDR